MKDGKMVYFGPYDSAALNKHMPVDGMLHDATVEGKESATAATKHEEKVSCCRGGVQCIFFGWVD
jgi:hypothetical protein